MGIEENKDIVRGYVAELINGQRYDKWEQYMSDEFSGNEGEITIKEDHKKYWDNMRTTMPDLQLEITDIMSEGDRVIALQKWTAHVALKNDHPSNGNYVESSNATLYELKNGKIVKGGSLTNIVLPLLQQFGIIPPLEELTKNLMQYL